MGPSEEPTGKVCGRACDCLVFSPIPLDAETGEPQVQGQPRLQSKFKANLDNLVRLCPKINSTKKRVEDIAGGTALANDQSPALSQNTTAAGLEHKLPNNPQPTCHGKSP